MTTVSTTQLLKHLKEDRVYNKMAKEIHETARAHGFWDKDRNMGEMLMLAVSEISEALEEDRDGHPPVWYGEGGKPEGAAVELADCVIRCLDTLYSYDAENPLDITEYVVHEKLLRINLNRQLPENFGDACLEICHQLVIARNNILPLTRAIVLCEELCERLGCELLGLAAEKMRYNDSRPHMHGKAY